MSRPMAINHLSPPTGQTADNIVGFARALRAAGIPVGPGSVIDAMNALQLVDIGNRTDVFATLETIFVKRHEHALIFAQAFDLFFRAADEWKQMLDSVSLPDQARKKPPPASRRVQDAFAQTQTTETPQVEEQEARLAVSDKEILRKKDFAQMTAAEIAEVTRAIAKMNLPQAELRTRRYRPDARGLRLDMRRTLRASLRTGGDIIDIRKLGRIEKPAPIVALLDISGSMSEYTRLFLHFLHAITDARKRVSVFLFGTRLTNVTRSLRARDPDEALARCSSAVEDWAGGTRIATSLHTFNKLWGRRVLGQGAVVLL
ncbi:MAG: VWA domain-containing protein, partial [Bradyrhizobium sp.]